jgi:hypothetical protein|tara:strand:+ start:403 stop:942 length:540 start_codon:yes stop_codon:yes gene_type:complete
MASYTTQNSLLLEKLTFFYNKNNNIDKILPIINGESKISLRLIDWFVTNYSKKYFTLIKNGNKRFKVYIDYKLKLKAYSKKRFDPFCRWDRITIPYKKNSLMETTIGQLNFFKWIINNNIIEYIEKHFDEINNDQFKRNSTSKNKLKSTNKTRKKREELSIFASKSIKKEKVKIVVEFK